MPRYVITLELTCNAMSQHDAAEMADNFCYAIEDNPPIYDLAPGDSSLRPVSISWPKEG